MLCFYFNAASLKIKGLRFVGIFSWFFLFSFRFLSVFLSLFQSSQDNNSQSSSNDSSVLTSPRIVIKDGKSRRRENMFGSRGKLINSLRHGKTPLTRYKKGELFSAQAFVRTALTTTTTTTSPTISSTQPTQQFANQILGCIINIETWIILPFLEGLEQENGVSTPSAIVGQLTIEASAELSPGDQDGFFAPGFRHLGGVGECRHDFHCIGSESCVRYRGNYMWVSIVSCQTEVIIPYVV